MRRLCRRQEQNPTRNDHLQYLQSVSKMHIAVENLQLRGQGKIDFDAPMTRYLPKKFSQYVTDANQITVRMLLNHTPGIPEYNENPEFLSHVLMHRLENFTSEQCLQAIANQPLMWKPDTKIPIR